MTDDDDARGLYRNTDPNTSKEAALGADRAIHWAWARRILRDLLIEYPAVSARMVRERANDEGFDPATAESIRRRIHQMHKEGVIVCIGESRALGGRLYIFRSVRTKRPPPPRSKRPPPPPET